MTITNRIEMDPKVMLGKPVIRGTRIAVELILRKLMPSIRPCPPTEDAWRLHDMDGADPATGLSHARRAWMRRQR